MFLSTSILVRPAHFTDPACHETISALELAESVPMVPNPAYEHISALDLADVRMMKNPAYMPIQPWQRQLMTICQACTTEPSPAVPSRPLPCPPELEMKRKQRQFRHKIKPAVLPLPVPIRSTSILSGHSDSYMDEPVPVQISTERSAHPEEV